MGLTFVVGGARSGKSSLAVATAAAQSRPVVFIATAEARDDEMAARIASHREERPAHWETIEEPVALARALQRSGPDSFVVVDCLTLWVTNALSARGSAWVLAEASRVIDAATARGGATLVVSNEVGSGIVPADPATRGWRDLLGTVNAQFSRGANAAYLAVAGRVLPLADADDLLHD